MKNTGTAFWLHAALLTVFIGASSAPSPLYEFYAREWGLGSAAVTVIFAVYAVAVLLTLLVVSRLTGSFDPPAPPMKTGRDAAT